MSTLKTNNIQAYTSDTVTISSSLVPFVASGSTTSSFNLGSPTAAWKDIYVSNGTITFLPSNTTLSTTDSGLILDKDIFVGGGANTPNYQFYAVRVGHGPFTSSFNTHVANTVVGTMAGYLATGSSNLNNTFIGYSAGYYGAQSSTFVGSQCFGNSAPNGLSNTGLGQGAGNYQNGDHNTYIGFGAGNGTSGSYNVFLGEYAGFFTTGSNNISIGTNTMFSASNNCSLNVVIGDNTGYYFNSGSRNTFIGNLAGYNLKKGGLNVAIGSEALYSSLSSTDSINNNMVMGRRAGYNLRSGSYNVFLGESAGAGVFSGSYNLFIGNDSGGDFGATSNYKLDVRMQNYSLIKGDFLSQSLDLQNKVSIKGDASANACAVTGSLIVGGGAANATLVIPTYSSNPSVTYTGSMYYNTSNNFLYIYTGTAWRSSSFA
jgi:hypothetical protein